MLGLSNSSRTLDNNCKSDTDTRKMQSRGGVNIEITLFFGLHNSVLFADYQQRYSHAFFARVEHSLPSHP